MPSAVTTAPALLMLPVAAFAQTLTGNVEVSIVHVDVTPAADPLLPEEGFIHA